MEGGLKWGGSEGRRPQEKKKIPEVTDLLSIDSFEVFPVAQSRDDDAPSKMRPRGAQ